MEGTKFLKPAFANMIIRDPKTKIPLSENGEEKPWIGREGIYWRRRVQDEDVIVVDKTEIKLDEQEKENNIKRRNK
jgi:hypothetical protein